MVGEIGGRERLERTNCSDDRRTEKEERMFSFHATGDPSDIAVSLLR